LVEELSRIVEVIKEEYDPERIIVFGSMAENNIHEWSDIDLLVVKRTSKRPLERVLELGRLVKSKVGIEEFRG
jgi:predicted nucleotidyltransferase